MKKVLVLIITLVTVLSFTGCAKKTDNTLRVGASITPHAEILKIAQPILAEQGITMEIVEFTDYVQPNTAVESGDLLVNYFQHQPYLDDFNANNGTHLVSVYAVHYEPFGIFAGKTASIDALTDGAIISVPNDGTNEGRALKLLEAQGLIKLKDGAAMDAKVLDIAENPKNLVIKELEAAQLTLSLQDVDLAVINGNYAIQAGLNASTDALAVESQDSDAAKTYANVLVVKEGNQQDPRVLALIEAMKSEEVKNFILETYKGAVVPMN